jgi:hypothetical protein
VDCGIAVVCRCAVSKRRPTRVPVKVHVVLLSVKGGKIYDQAKQKKES